MATKRILYKPAQTTVGPKRNRRPLAQGRLVTEPTHPSSSGARLQQGVVTSEEDQEVIFNFARDDPNATPRRSVPRVTTHHSPVATPPHRTLDLSDSDDDHQRLPHQPSQARGTPNKGAVGPSPGHSDAPSPGHRVFPVTSVPHVMLLDASRVTGSPRRDDDDDDDEENDDCVEGYERSPATIIRHDRSGSPPDAAAAAAIPSEEAVWKIPVEGVTKVKVLTPGSQRSRSDNSSLNSSASSSAMLPQQPADADTPSPNPHPDDIETLVSRSLSRGKVRVTTSTDRKKQGIVGHIAQPRFDDDSTDGEKGRGKGIEATSDSETCSLFEYVPQTRPKSSTEASGKAAAPPKSTKKKKGERTVPSRYMQSAQSKKVTTASSLSADKGLVVNRNVNHSGSTNTNNSGMQSVTVKRTHSSVRPSSSAASKPLRPTPNTYRPTSSATSGGPTKSTAQSKNNSSQHKNNTSQPQNSGSRPTSNLSRPAATERNAKPTPQVSRDFSPEGAQKEQGVGQNRRGKTSQPPSQESRGFSPGRAQGQNRRGKAPPPQPAPKVSLDVSPPDRAQGQNRRGKTSTPTHDEFPAAMVSCDASAIQPELSMMYSLDGSQFRQGGAGSGASQKARKVDLNTQQYILDLQYARYLQWVFLDTKAKMCLEQQEQEAMTQMHALWLLLEEKKQEKATKERELARLRHLNSLDAQLDVQQRALEPVVKVLPALRKDYEGLTVAVDSTRHQIATHGIHLPDDETAYEESLEQLLMETEELLGTINAMTGQKSTAADHLSQSCTALQQAIDQQCTELNGCGEMLSALQSLTTQENSLRIQDMQSH